MHSRIDAKDLKARVLLLSPLMGSSMREDVMYYSRPAGLGSLEAAILSKRIVKPSYLEIQSGEEDRICCPRRAEKVAVDIAADHCEIIENEGHNLSHDLVQKIIREFLAGAV